MRMRTYHVFAVSVMLLVAIGCSGGGNPVTTPGKPDLQSSSAPSGHSQTHLWGYYDVYIDLQSLTATVIVDRHAMFTANVVNFLNGNASNLAVKINSIQNLSNEMDIDVDVSLKHPFPGMHQYDGYDVRGVFIANGSGMMDYNNLLGYAIKGTDQYLGNADGYTRWFNPTEFTHAGMFGYTPGKAATPGYNATGTLNPYKYFADGLGKTQDLWGFLTTSPDTHRGKFSAGTINTRNYQLSFPTPTPGVKFEYAVTADWTSETAHPSNAVESVGLSVTVTPDIYYVDNTKKGGDLILDVNCFGWNHQPSTIFVESTVLKNPTQVDLSTAATGGGQFTSTYHVDIPADNVNGTQGNEFWLICEYGGFGYENPFGIGNGAGKDKLAAFFRYDLPVSNVQPCQPPLPTAIDPTWGYANAPKTCTITCTNLSGTTGIAAYLDKSGVLDGSYDITGTGITNVNVAAGTFDATFNLNGAKLGYYYVVVTNSCGETGKSDTKLFQVKEYVHGDIFVSNHPDFDGVPQEGTEAHPYHTIAQGIGAANNSGKVVLVDYGTGTYPEELWFGSMFTLRAYNWYSDSGRPLIGGPTCTSDSQAAVLNFFSDNDVTVQGFKIAFAGGAQYSDCRMIFNIYAYNINFIDDFFTGNASQQWTHWCTVLDGIGCHDCAFTNCLFKDLNGSTNASAYDDYDIRGVSALYSYNMLVNKCEFTKFQSNPVNPVGTYGIYIFPIIFQMDSGAFSIHNNLFHHIDPSYTDNAGHPINNFCAMSTYYMTPPPPPYPNGAVYCNTIDNMSAASNSNNYGSNIIALNNQNSDSGVPYADIYNNIISSFLGTTSEQLFGIRDIEKTDYTDIWHALRGSSEFPWFDMSNEGMGCIYSDPKYVNNSSEPYDYHLASGSPCVGTGKGGADMGCYSGLDPDEVIGLLGPED